MGLKYCVRGLDRFNTTMNVQIMKHLYGLHKYFLYTGIEPVTLRTSGNCCDICVKALSESFEVLKITSTLINLLWFKFCLIKYFFIEELDKLD